MLNSMQDLQTLLTGYDYAFPEDLIATSPASPRDSAKLLVFERKTGKTHFTTFAHVGDHLPENAVLVLNKTKVIPAKMELTRSTGGRVNALALGVSGESLRTMANRKLKLGEYLTLHDKKGFTVTGDEGRHWLLTPDFPIAELNAVLDRHGHMPLPPYIKRTPLTPEELRREYQSVFASDEGSIAAPTASLHFTPELLDSLRISGIRIAEVTLHVHLGTFAPLTDEQLKTGLLHEEAYRIDAKTRQMLETAKQNGDPIIAVGTTVVRTLESASGEGGKIVEPEGRTRLFIREGYEFTMVDHLITNFHVPRSSLMMLVAAMTGRETLMKLYLEAIERKFRLFSFGDAMLIV